MTDSYSKKLAEIKENIIKSLDELSSTDLMQISIIAKEIVDKRMEDCRASGLFGDNRKH